MQTFEDNELFRFEEIAFDVALIFGNTTDQGLTRSRRSVNRAMLALAGTNKRWSWLKVKDTFNTISGTREYSLTRDVKVLHQMWIDGANRQRIDRLPTSTFVERVPNPDDATGTPRLYDEEGVDSSGAKVISLYPVPSSILEINFRYTRQIVPILTPEADIRSYWGLPAHLLEALTTKSAAFALRGVNGTKSMELEALANAQIDEAYASDQEGTTTTFRAPMQEGRDRFSDDVMLPPTYGWE